VTAPSASTSDALLTVTSYNARGEAYQVQDAKGLLTASTFDDAGRLIETVEDSGGEDRTTQFVYNADGKLETMTAISPSNVGTGDQVTTWTYGTALNGSGVASSLLLRFKTYPDSTGGSDRVSYQYDRQGAMKEMVDPAGTTHAYDYDKLGRLIDDVVKRISREYEARGMLARVTSYNDATVGSGDVVNDVQLEYNDFAQLETDYQSHDGEVNTSTTPKVGYGYASGSANTIRRTSTTYPNSRVLAFVYGSGGSMASELSRVEKLTFGGSDVVEYNYLGLSEFVRDAYPTIELTYIKQGMEEDGPAGDQYNGLDRFGRVVDQRWVNSSGDDVERVKYGFDENNNRCWRNNPVADTLSAKQDEFYIYDGLNQLTNLQRGTLNGGKNGIETPAAWEEGFTLDPTGNWKAYVTAVNGGTPTSQSRTHNKVNELTAIDSSEDYVAEDGAGNMTTVPKPGVWDAGYDLIYDAWNRLVTVEGGSTSIAYEYDGLTRRTKKTTGSTIRHFYYSDQWQILEERLGSATTPDRHFLWGQRYADDLVLRDRDVGATGTFNERLYTVHDYFHPTGVTNTSGVVQERYGYDAYGLSRVMDDSFDVIGSSAYDWETRFGAYRWDQETGLYQVRYRYLHPTLGRWLTRDPIAEIGGFNLYQYVNGSPTNFIDTLGLIDSITGTIINCARCPGYSFAKCACLFLAAGEDDVKECEEKLGGCINLLTTKNKDIFAFCECACTLYADKDEQKECTKKCKDAKKVKNFVDRVKKEKPQPPKDPKAPPCPDPDDEYKNIPDISIPNPPRR
jgi:RHS repeat-associated protein